MEIYIISKNTVLYCIFSKYSNSLNYSKGTIFLDVITISKENNSTFLNTISVIPTLSENQSKPGHRLFLNSEYIYSILILEKNKF